MIASIQEFLSYFASIRKRTLTFCRAVPEELIDWAPRPGEYTFGDIIRHLAASEQMFTGVAVADRWEYPGHERSLGPTLSDALFFLDSTHTTALATIGALSDADLQAPRAVIGEGSIAVWRILMLMIEHEVHHRSQIAEYISANGREPPQIYGLKIEEVMAYTESAMARSVG